MKTTLKTFAYFLAIIGIYSSCKPIHRLTSLQRLPREYSENYNTEGVKAERSAKHKQAWIVYADRSGDAAYQNPGGKIKSADIAFLEPFLVIGRKGDYLELIKYKEDNIEFHKFANRKEAEYVGWVHLSHLITSPSAITDVRSSKQERHLTALSDTTILFHASDYLASADSLKCFDSPLMETSIAQIGLYEMVYAIKESANKKMILVARSATLEPDKVADAIIGWIPRSTLQDIGKGLYLALSSKSMIQPMPLKYTPVVNQMTNDSISLVRSAISRPVVDMTRRKVLNVNGESISYNQSLAIMEKAKQINILFSIEQSAHLKEIYPMLLTVIYNIRDAVSNAEYNYHFGAAIHTTSGIQTIPMIADFNTFCDKLSNYSTQIDSTSTNAISQWESLEKGLSMLRGKEENANIVLSIGERIKSSEQLNKQVADALAQQNCRLLGWQIYAGVESSYNNFVLELSQQIERYAEYQLTASRKHILYTDQLRYANVFNQFSPNQYMLNYPERAITQGMILFPEKEKLQEVNTLSLAFDTLLMQVQSDISGLEQRFHKAFTSIGNVQDVYDKAFAERFSLPPNSRLDKNFATFFKEKSPLWFSPIATFKVDKSSKDYLMLLSKPELETWKEKFDELTAQEPDLKDVAKQKKANTKSVCAYLRIEDDQLSKEMLREYASGRISKQEAAVDTIQPMVELRYASTRKVRRHLRKFYYSSLNNCSVCKNNIRRYKKLTLSEAHQQIFGLPSNDARLDSLLVKDLRTKRELSNAQLDHLISYFKESKEEFESKHSQEQFQSGEETYYYISTDLMP